MINELLECHLVWTQHFFDAGTIHEILDVGADVIAACLCLFILVVTDAYIGCVCEDRKEPKWWLRGCFLTTLAECSVSQF